MLNRAWPWVMTQRVAFRCIMLQHDACQDDVSLLAMMPMNASWPVTMLRTIDRDASWRMDRDASRCFGMDPDASTCITMSHGAS